MDASLPNGWCLLLFACCGLDVSLWRSTNARALANYYHQKTQQFVIDDLLEKITKSIELFEGPFKALYEKIKDIPE